MLVLAAPPFHEVAMLLGAGGAVPASASYERFANGELHVTVTEKVAGRACTVLGSITPPDAQMLSTLLLCHTLAKEGAREVTALLPYLAYSRQDKDEEQRSLAAAWTGALLRASRADRIVTFDIHSPRAGELLGLPVVSLSPAGAFARAWNAIGLGGDAVAVAPDEGAAARCQDVADAAGAQRPIARLHKRRSEAGIVHTSFEGAVGRHAVVIDDILDTGATLVSCCRMLLRAGAREITVMVTHGLFTGIAWKELWSVGVRRILTSDTVPLRPGIDASNIRVVPLLAEAAPHLCRPDQRRDS